MLRPNNYIFKHVTMLISYLFLIVPGFYTTQKTKVLQSKVFVTCLTQVQVEGQQLCYPLEVAVGNLKKRF